MAKSNSVLTTAKPTIQYHRITFNDQHNITFLYKNQPYVCIQTIAQHMGLNWSAQLKRINNNAVLSAALLVGFAPVTTEIEEALIDPITQPVAGLPIHLLNGWLFTVTVKKPAIKKILTAYQRDFYRKLAKYWFKKPELKSGFFDDTMESLHMIKALTGTIPSNAISARLADFIDINMHLTDRAKDETLQVLFNKASFGGNNADSIERD